MPQQDDYCRVGFGKGGTNAQTLFGVSDGVDGFDGAPR
jgi:hypothetical protein